MDIRVKMNLLEAKTEFPYLRRTVRYKNCDWTELYRNLRKDQRRWAMLDNVLGKKGAPIKAWAMMYKAVV